MSASLQSGLIGKFERQKQRLLCDVFVAKQSIRPSWVAYASRGFAIIWIRGPRPAGDLSSTTYRDTGMEVHRWCALRRSFALEVNLCFLLHQRLRMSLALETNRCLFFPWQLRITFALETNLCLLFPRRLRMSLALEINPYGGQLTCASSHHMTFHDN